MAKLPPGATGTFDSEGPLALVVEAADGLEDSVGLLDWIEPSLEPATAVKLLCACVEDETD